MEIDGRRRVIRLPRQRTASTPHPAPAHPGSAVAGRARREPTRLGRYVIDRMSSLEMTKQVHLVEASGLSAPTISRVIYEHGYNPDRETIAALAVGLDVSFEQLLLFMHNLSAPTGEPDPVPADPLLADIARLLGAESPLDDQDRTNLRRTISRDLAPYRRRKSA